MKKNLRKIISLVLVLAMSLAISVPAFAAENAESYNVSDYNISIQIPQQFQNIDLSKKGYTREKMTVPSRVFRKLVFSCLVEK